MYRKEQKGCASPLVIYCLDERGKQGKAFSLKWLYFVSTDLLHLAAEKKNFGNDYSQMTTSSLLGMLSGWPASPVSLWWASVSWQTGKEKLKLLSVLRKG